MVQVIWVENRTPYKLWFKVCLYVYYVHCMSHRLQLALVVASKGVIPTHYFFNRLNYIINTVGVSYKRNDQLKAADVANVAHLLDTNEL